MENEERKIKPSLLWLKRKYDEFNKAYFNGELMENEDDLVYLDRSVNLDIEDASTL